MQNLQLSPDQEVRGNLPVETPVIVTAIPPLPSHARDFLSLPVATQWQEVK